MDRLEIMFEKQKELIEKINSRNGETGDIPRLILSAMTELGEYANQEGSFKWWKKNHKSNIEKELEEFVDIWFFLLQIAIKKGYTPDRILKKYIEKWNINMDRQKNNY